MPDQKMPRLERAVLEARDKFARLEALFHVIKERLEDDCTYEWLLADLGSATAAQYAVEMNQIGQQHSAEQSSLGMGGA
ncbi:hypothetical protein NX872_21140 [Burkholderia thailandensis]|uniref:hypothetical protein n=1 Tax=Burkholderia thailandensis TaxID=57975 RepID=UPI00217D334B|nr:hypothetical protein [Burkholderia thailandensis]MCS6490764.1 hypothetical protein [Burkholderia thailandensis]MCS6518140.1 hypothetical protein [Burkholderia thailandensis]